jgi:5-methylcytosine-specific restriction enzyme subunit McrC
MLAYAFRNINIQEAKEVEAESFDNIHDLLAFLFASGLMKQIKRGLCKDYLSVADEIGTVKGKINITDTLSRRSMSRGRICCEYDDYNENSYVNQILKTTAFLLIRSNKVSKDYKDRLQKAVLYFSNVNTLNPYTIKWKSVSYNRNNNSYRFLINICYLVINSMLLSSNDGDIKLHQFIDDQHMHKLYEKFILEYYREEHPELHPNASQVIWNLDMPGEFDYLLPSMITDITLSKDDKVLIIDAKYYSHSMTIASGFSKSSYISNNLYQIFTYVKNKDRFHTGNVSGMLLYAKTDEEVVPDSEYMMGGNRISVKCLDLNVEFVDIRRQLDVYVHYFKI